MKPSMVWNAATKVAEYKIRQPLYKGEPALNLMLSFHSSTKAMEVLEALTAAYEAGKAEGTRSVVDLVQNTINDIV